jgi:hypothetical protein
VEEGNNRRSREREKRIYNSASPVRGAIKKNELSYVSAKRMDAK